MSEGAKKSVAAYFEKAKKRIADAVDQVGQSRFDFRYKADDERAASHDDGDDVVKDAGDPMNLVKIQEYFRNGLAQLSVLDGNRPPTELSSSSVQAFDKDAPVENKGSKQESSDEETAWVKVASCSQASNDGKMDRQAILECVMKTATLLVRALERPHEIDLIKEFKQSDEIECDAANEAKLAIPNWAIASELVGYMDALVLLLKRDEQDSLIDKAATTLVRRCLIQVVDIAIGEQTPHFSLSQLMSIRGFAKRVKWPIPKVKGAQFGSYFYEHKNAVKEAAHSKKAKKEAWKVMRVELKGLDKCSSDDVDKMWLKTFKSFSAFLHTRYLYYVPWKSKRSELAIDQLLAKAEVHELSQKGRVNTLRNWKRSISAGVQLKTILHAQRKEMNSKVKSYRK